MPTEAEWEKAARAGAVTRYSFGDDERELGEYAWYHVNSGGQSHPVGLKKSNQYGVYDMAGNVWEWVADRYGVNYYKTAPPENPKGPGSGPQRVLRGGSWNFFDVSQRPGDRASDFPSARSQRGGFRCAF
jgi:formylglycine-generating enzyme required for sulfatase activity